MDINPIDTAINRCFTDAVLDKILRDISATPFPADVPIQYSPNDLEAIADKVYDDGMERLTEARRQKPVLDDDFDGMRGIGGTEDGFGGDRFERI